MRRVEVCLFPCHHENISLLLWTSISRLVERKQPRGGWGEGD
jgi:hypothetical protein